MFNLLPIDFKMKLYIEEKNRLFIENIITNSIKNKIYNKNLTYLRVSKNILPVVSLFPFIIYSSVK
jgi:hypothetical protein